MAKLTITPQMLNDMDLFAGLPEDILSALAARCTPIELHAGELLFKQGDTADSLYRLEEGQLHMIRHHDDDETFILKTMSPYELVGELSMLAEEKRAVSAMAVSDCVIVILRNSDIMDVAADHPVLSMHLLQKVSKRLAKLHLDVHEYAIGHSSAEARLASLLLLMADNRAATATDNIHKHQMARAIGVDFVWVDSKLSDWAISGYIAVRGSAVEVLNVAALQSIAGNSPADF